MTRGNTLKRSRIIVTSTVLLFLSCAMFCGVGISMASSEGGHGSASEGGHGGPGWVATDTYRVINFVVLAGALFLVLRKPLSKGLGDRIKGIERQLADLEARKREAEEKLAETNKRIATLEKEAETIVAGYVQQGKEAKARILEEAKAVAQKLELQAKRNIENEFKKAKAQLQDEILDKALAKAEGVIRSNINSGDQEKLVEEFLKKVVA